MSDGPALPERLAGAVWGHLVGDAVGVPYEFREPDAIAVVRFGATGTHGQPPGTWSDDGALMLALLDSLLGEPAPGDAHPTPRFDPEDQGRRALAWFRDGAYTPDGDGRFDVGSTTSRAMRALASGAPALEAGPHGDRDAGNGSLMRILPLGLVLRDAAVTPDAELVELAARASAVTHRHPLAQAACAVYALVVRRLLAGERDPSAALEAAIRAARAAADVARMGNAGATTAASLRSAADVARTGNQRSTEPSAPLAAGLLDALDELARWPDRSGRGYVVDSFWSAWDAFAGATGYRETIERSVRFGHDTDTTAAIAGGLAGTFWGLDGAHGIPAEWLAGMRGRSIVTPLVDRLIATGPWRTSTTHPIRVDQVDLAAMPGFADASARGALLGMSLLPGKRLPGWTGEHWRDLDADIDRLRETYGIDTYLLLVEDQELVEAGVPDLVGAAERRGIEVLRHPVPDLEVPADRAAFRATLDAVAARLRAGRRVLVTCRGGLGRSGTAVACLLVDAGVPPDEAIGRTRAARPGAIERPGQEAFVREWG